jgi:ubiquinone/menaquinone biosynthesis C-methylase UbiE
MGLDLEEIYASKADDYERLVIREDYQGNILTAISNIRTVNGMDIVDLGAGTGRIACMLAPFARSVIALDASDHMLSVARQKLEHSGLTNWRIETADHHHLPVEDASVDIVISGWSLVYAAIWAKGDWRESLRQALVEIRRILRPGGTIIILETMGTGGESPNPPADLLDYFDFLKNNGFESTWIRTDYRFSSAEEAQFLTEFFFGNEMLSKISKENPILLPECTGIWWQHIR